MGAGLPVRGARALKVLLDDQDIEVRIAAYESLALNNDPIVDRVVVSDPEQGMKFVIDRVPSERPLVYVTHEQMPRIVIYGPQLGFKTPMVARLWDNHLMIKGGDDQPMSVFYQARHETEGKRFDNVYPSVATLAYLMGHRPTLEQPQEGMNLSYSEVVDAVYKLCQAGHIDAPIEFKVSPLQIMINQYQQLEVGRDRPETATSSGEQPDGSARAESSEMEERTAAASTSRPETAEAQP